MAEDWTSEEIWRSSLKLQMANLRRLESDETCGAKELAKARDRVERIWMQGRSEWRANGKPSRLP